ncbi:hypothetical protein [Streptomyces sp. NPDC001089]
MTDPLYTDARFISPAHGKIANETAAALGPDWRVEYLLSSALVVHPIGFRVCLDYKDGDVQLTAHVAVSPEPTSELETVTAAVAGEEDHTTTAHRTADAIRAEILPHFGREHAVAGLRVLSMPLRDAGISAVAQGSNAETVIEYRPELLLARTCDLKPEERRPLGVIIRSTGRDDTRVEVRIPFLPVREAAGITRSLRPGLSGTPMQGIENLPEEHRSTLAVTFPGMTVKHVVSDVPRYDDLKDPSGVLTIRHATLTTRADDQIHTQTWAAVWLRNASVAQAYAVLAAYAAT